MADSPEPTSSDRPLSPAEAPGSLDGVKYAGFWIRVGAAILDWLVLIPLWVPSLFVQNGAIYLLLMLLVLLYKPCFEKLKGATPGKMLVGLRVVNPQGGGLSWGSAWLRSAFVILSMVPNSLMGMKMRQAGINQFDFERMQEFQAENSGLQTMSWITSLLYLASVIVVAFHPRKQGLHDMLADTFVVYRESLPHSSR